MMIMITFIETKQQRRKKQMKTWKGNKTIKIVL